MLAFGGVDLVVNNAGLSISKPLLETTEADWDLQHDVMAKGSFLVSREAARAMVAQGMGGDIVYISSKNAVFAGPNNLAYGAAKADQAHQVRLLAAELGEHGIRVNGINPDGVVRGSGIFAGGWGAQRAAVYGVPRRSSARSTPSAPCSSGRCCPSTWPTPCSSSPPVSCRTPPGCTSRSTPAWPRRSCAEVPVPTFAAIDIGATSGRVVNVTIGADTIELAEVHRFPNATVGAGDHLAWDFAGLLAEVRSGLATAAAGAPLRSVAVDTWAVDYGLLTDRGEPLGPVNAYRSTRTDGIMERTLATVGAERIYNATGIQFLPFNTAYQLLAHRGSPTTSGPPRS